MIYLHRFIYLIAFIICIPFAAFIGISAFVLVIPLYAIAYYIVFGNSINEEQVEKMVNCILHPIFKFLELIKPNK